ncbi:response regulator [Sorangium sp. So ce1078]|uniref:response regulator n=1 Tax=Sorangium sp. So ce1078 TaxID=3133329 RepID=UPI003F607220
MPFAEFNALLDKDGALRDVSDTSRPRVVVVDDDAVIRKSLFGLLGAQYQVTACASAKEGIHAVDDETCAVILDVKMGRHDGFWACDQIRMKCSDVPVIFYSAYQDAKDPYDIINDHRPFGYVTKSGDIKRLLDAVEAAVGLHLRILEGKRTIELHRRMRDKSA